MLSVLSEHSSDTQTHRMQADTSLVGGCTTGASRIPTQLHPLSDRGIGCRLLLKPVSQLAVSSCCDCGLRPGIEQARRPRA